MNPGQTHVNWPQLYRAAVLELDNEKVLNRIGLAVEAIRGRLRELAGDGNGSGEEKRKIEGSLAILHLLLKHEVQRGVQESTRRSLSGISRGGKGGRAAYTGVGMPKIIIRCPYCVEGDTFKVMAAKDEGAWFLCSSCGHVAIRGYPSYRCNCEKCIERAPLPIFVF